MRPDYDYINFDPFEGDRDTDVRLRKASVVITRKTHTCGGNSYDTIHEMPAGTRARFETAIVDGKWERYWYCTDCIDKWFEEIGKDLS